MNIKWDRPTKLELNKALDTLGGTGAVCELLRKHRATVSKWRRGDGNIDYPSWVMVQNELEKLQ